MQKTLMEQVHRACSYSSYYTSDVALHPSANDIIADYRVHIASADRIQANSFYLFASSETPPPNVARSCRATLQ